MSFDDLWHGSWDSKFLTSNMVVQYDKNHSGALEFEELRSVLADLGMLVRTPIPSYLSSL